MKHMARKKRSLVLGAPVLVTMAAGLTWGSASTASANKPARYTPTARDYYINWIEPQVQRSSDGREVVGEGNVNKPAPDPVTAYDRKISQGNPVAGRTLAKIEAQAAKTGKNPKQIRYKNSDQTQIAKLLTILIECNPNANDHFTGTMVPQAVQDDPLTPENERDCVQGGITNGPLHNRIPNPANASHKDNNSMWVPDFSSDFYNRMLYTTTGIQQRVRPDLKGPDGKKGVDLRGYTMHNMYLEMSKGAYTVDGQATAWVQVPHSEAWYGQDTCLLVDGVWVAGASQDDNGHPDNPGGVAQLGSDAVDVLAAANPNFPWADYDVEDVADADGDGNFNEPDGVIDHLVLVHAGKDASGGGGAEGTQAIWAHSSAIIPGHT